MRGRVLVSIVMNRSVDKLIRREIVGSSICDKMVVIRSGTCVVDRVLLLERHWWHGRRGNGL